MFLAGEESDPNTKGPIHMPYNVASLLHQINLELKECLSCLRNTARQVSIECISPAWVSILQAMRIQHEGDAG